MRIKVFCLLLAVAVLTTSCFGFPLKAAISENETGIIMSDGTSISNVVGAGRYRDGHMFAKMVQIDNSARQYTWSGTDLWTKDKQPLDFIITVTYHRTRDPLIIEALWGTYYSIFVSDGAMDNMVASRIPESAKKMSVRDVLEGILGISEGSGGRDAAQTFIFNDLTREFLQFGVVCDNVTIETVTASEEYVARLQEKANAQLQVEVSKQNTLKLNEELNQEIAQTQKDLEIARRENLVAEEKAKVYEISDRAYELEKLKLTANIVSDTAQVWFIDPDTDLTLLIGADGVVPVQ